MLAGRVTSLTLALACALGAQAGAQGWIEPIVAPAFPGGGIQRIRGAVQVTVTGRVARVTVEEWFRNAGAGLGEGIYHYPLPGEAVFSSYSLWQGDQELRGEAMDAGQARSIYEQIVRQKRDPALIELVGHGLIRARVFPINPGETRKITLRYTQLLDRAGDAWRFRYAAGREVQGSPTARSFRLVVDSAGRFGDPFSPTHRVSTQRSDGRLEVTLADTSWAQGGDLELFLPLARGLVGLSLVAHQPVGEDGYFMLLLAPGAAAQTEAVRRDVVAVVDVSGSMSGEKLEQARAALVQLLGTLHEGDRFRLVAFSSGVRRYSEGWTAATADNRRQAQEWVRSLQAEGGTNIAGALAEAFAAPPAEGALGVVVFLTDGLPTVGDSDPERIADGAERARGGFRVFAFGIGFDVNTFLLDRLVERARGASAYIQPGSNIEQAVASLTAKIASPVLTDLAVSSQGGEVYDMQPASLPDLFAGDELVVFGRYRGAGSGEWSVSVRGRRGGHEEQFTTAGPVGNSANDYIPQLWAARKAGALARELRLHGQNPELVRALKELALRYGILTEYTAYLVQEPNVVAVNRDQLMRERPAPAAQVGAQAIGEAQRQSKAASAATAADAAEFDHMLLARSGIAPTQRVGGRLFILRDSTWTDLGHGDSLRVVTVAPYSDAYFALLRALPELAKTAALEPSVLVAGRRVSVKIGTGGTETWRPGELERLVREFRG